MSNNLIINAAVYGASGYATLSRNIVLGLHNMGIKIKLETNIYEIHDIVQEPYLSILQSLEKTIFPNDIIPPKLCIGIAPWFDTKYKGYKIGYTMFEFNNLPNVGKYNWYNYCINMNEIWVPSTYNLNMFNINGIKNTLYMPVGIDLDKFKKQKLQKENNEFIFLSVGEFNYRKGWDILLSAFIEEFDSNDNVKLVIKSFEHDKLKDTYEKKILNKIDEFIKNKDNPPKIEIIIDIIEPNKMPSIYQNADIFVMATLGEGLGLPMLEAMACDIPCILPDNSGYLDFVNSSNGWLVKINGYKKDDKLSDVSISYFDSVVPDIDIKDFRKCMREAYENTDIRFKKSNKCRKDISEYFEIKNNINKIFERVICLPELSSIVKNTYIEGLDELEINNDIISDYSEISIRGLKSENIHNNEEYSIKFINNVLNIKNEIDREIEDIDKSDINIKKYLIKKQKIINEIIRKF